MRRSWSYLLLCMQACVVLLHVVTGEDTSAANQTGEPNRTESLSWINGTEIGPANSTLTGRIHTTNISSVSSNEAPIGSVNATLAEGPNTTSVLSDSSNEGPIGSAHSTLTGRITTTVSSDSSHEAPIGSDSSTLTGRFNTTSVLPDSSNGAPVGSANSTLSGRLNTTSVSSVLHFMQTPTKRTTMKRINATSTASLNEFTTSLPDTTTRTTISMTTSTSNRNKITDTTTRTTNHITTPTTSRNTITTITPETATRTTTYITTPTTTRNIITTFVPDIPTTAPDIDTTTSTAATPTIFSKQDIIFEELQEITSTIKDIPTTTITTSTTTNATDTTITPSTEITTSTKVPHIFSAAPVTTIPPKQQTTPTMKVPITTVIGKETTKLFNAPTTVAPMQDTTKAFNVPTTTPFSTETVKPFKAMSPSISTDDPDVKTAVIVEQPHKDIFRPDPFFDPPTTDPPPVTPEGLTLVNISVTVVNITWISPEVNFTITLNRLSSGNLSPIWAQCQSRENESVLAQTTEPYYVFRKVLPGDSYEVKVKAWRQEYGPEVNQTFNISVPDLPVTSHKIDPSSTSATIRMDLKKLKKTKIIKYWALMWSTESSNVDVGYCLWDNKSWPELQLPSRMNQATDNYNKFDSSQSVITYELSNLRPETKYFLVVTLFYDDYYTTFFLDSFVTDKKTEVALILAIIFGLLLVSLLGFFGVMLWKRGLFNKVSLALFGDNNEQREEDDATRLGLLPMATKPTITPIQYGRVIKLSSFPAFCAYLESDPSVQREHWDLLNAESKEADISFQTTIATLPENKRKNRYPNILPWDHSRVQLHIDEDDEISSDYINASFIMGHSGKPEYIATQGPLSGTCRDFWKMVIQENVTVIVMVSKFIENNKDKCYKYFPNKHETMLVGDDIEVRCSTELHFGVYCERTLQIMKDLVQISVTHMQFLEWPDFDVPTGTENMLQFCHQMRLKSQKEGGIILVHCSAGVGRTGTLIAADILLQQIKTAQKISVHNTVLDLRKERKNMVQTVVQYMYIHQLVRSMLENPIVDDESNLEHLYENVGSCNSTFYVKRERDSPEPEKDSEENTYSVENENIAEDTL